MMLGFALGQTWQVVFSTATVVCEAIMVFGAIMLNARPTKHFVWGITLLVFSIASFIG